MLPLSFNTLLSNRERHVLELSIQGMGDKEVANELSLGCETVRTYWSRIRAKLPGKTRAEIIASYVRSQSTEILEAERSENLRLSEEIALRRELEERLRASENLFRTTCEVSPVGILLLDEELNCTFANQAFTRIVGMNLMAMSGHGWMAPLSAESRAAFEGRPFGAATSAAPYETRVRISRQDGQERLLELRVSCSPSLSEGARYVAITEDVTEKARMTAFKDGLISILNATPDVVASFDLDGRTIFINQSMKHAFTAKDQAVSERRYDSMEEVFPASLHAFLLASAIPEAMKNGFWQGEITPSEHPVAVPYSFVLVTERDERGTFTRISIIGRDIREAKRVEAELKHQKNILETVAAATRDILYIYDLAEGRNVYSNHSVGKVLGYSEEQISAMGTGMLKAICHPEDWPLVVQTQERLSHLMVEHGTELTYRVVRPDGSIRSIEDRGSVLSRENGKAKLILGVATDVTDFVAESASRLGIKADGTIDSLKLN